MLVINCYGKDLSVRLKTHLSTEGMNTVTLTRAVIPHAYFNVSDKLKNNMFRYMTGEKENGQLKVFGLTIRNGLYSVESLNDEIQRVMTRNGHSAGHIVISYVEARGRINLMVRKPYMVYIHGEITKLLGIPSGYYPNEQGKDLNMRGMTECQFTRHTEYRITCNLVDKSKNLHNGIPSDVLAILQPKIGRYGDSFEYNYGVPIPVQEAGFSDIRIRVLDQNMEEIKFQEPLQILLTLQ